MKPLSKVKNVTGSLGNNVGFLTSKYSAEDHIGNEIILKLLDLVEASTPAAYHISRAFTLFSAEFFNDHSVFPLRSFVQKPEYGDKYIKNLAGGTLTARKKYFADCRQNSPSKKGSSTGAISQIKDRYFTEAKKQDIQKGAQPYDWLYLKEFFAKKIKEAEEYRSKLEVDLIKNIDVLAKSLGIDEIDKRIFKFLLAIQNKEDFFKLIEEISPTEEMEIEVAACVTGTTKQDYVRRTSIYGELSKKGLLTFSDETTYQSIPERVFNLLVTGFNEEDDYIRVICGQECKTDLSVEDYPHLEDEIKIAQATLQDALTNNKKGVNILLYGDIGTGKTELVKAIAKSVGAKLYRPGEKKETTHEIFSRKERFEAISIAQALLKGTPNVLLSIDEMEDLLPNEDEARGKAHFNRLLEENVVPVIWTVNDREDFDPSYLRRFAWSIEVLPPSADVRTNMFKRTAGKMGYEITDSDAEYMGTNFTASPALIEKALKVNAVVSTPGSKSVDRKTLVASLQNSAKLIYDTPTAFQQSLIASTDYDLSLANAKVGNLPISLEELTQKLQGSTMPITMIVTGPPGTGKTAFGNYFSVKTLGKEVLVKEYSSLASQYVGGTEKNLDKAFKAARNDGKVLMINEADSLLRSRSGAHASWEVTQVNEILTQLEKTEVPVIMTTNFVKELDPASVRRFMFMINLGTLKPEQLGQCYKKFFDRDLPKKHNLGGLGLATGDFASVAAVYKAFNQNMTDVELESYLAAKVTQRSDYRESVGFNNAGRHYS